MDAASGAPTRRAFLSRSPRAVSARLVRVGLRVLFGLAEQAARLPAAVAAGRGCAVGDCDRGGSFAKSEIDGPARGQRGAALFCSATRGCPATSAPGGSVA